MAKVKPFQAGRPQLGYVEEVTILPRGFMDRSEARASAEGNPWSFLHVDKAEIDVADDIDWNDDRVNRKARENLEKYFIENVFLIDEKPCYYLYQLETEGRRQMGVAGCPSIDDYLNGSIKKHEFTRADKESNCARNLDIVNANTSPVYLACRPSAELSAIAADWADKNCPIYDFTAEDGVRHTVWKVDDNWTIDSIAAAFDGIDSLYIADGHHRCAATVRLGQMRRETFPAYTGEEAFNTFLAVIFPSDQLYIKEYNRIVEDLNGYTPELFLARLEETFTVEAAASPVKPAEKHTFGMYVDGKWYRLRAKEGSFNAENPVTALDVSILQDNVLVPILGIKDSRTDTRLAFLGGFKDLSIIEQKVDSGDYAVGFSLFPTGIDELMDVADLGRVMPPKSTWFEPKLRTGLFIRSLSNSEAVQGATV